MDLTRWVLDQIPAHLPGGAHPANAALQRLVDGLWAVRGKAASLFGMTAPALDAQAVATLESALQEALMRRFNALHQH